MLNIIRTEADPDFLCFVAHPFANMFPMIEGNAFEELKRDIAAQGILEPIRLYQGMILDGRNRYAAGKAAGHHFTLDDFVEWEGTLAEAEGVGDLDQPSPSPAHHQAEARLDHGYGQEKSNALRP